MTEPDRARSVPPGEKAKLWKMAMGLCAFPHCTTDLVYQSKDPLFGGKVAHIAADSPSGPRGRDPLPLSRRHLYENLILLCPSHHDEIDALVDQYPAQLLRDMKNEHERRMAIVRQLGSGWSQRFITIDFLNLPRLLMLGGTSSLSEQLERDGLGDLMSLRGLPPLRKRRVMQAAERTLEGWAGRAVPFDGSGVEQLEAGTVISFTHRFYMKNIPAPESTKPLVGDLKEDPHLWMKVGPGRFTMPLDPAWITTATAFRSGAHCNFSGLAVVKDHADARMVGSAIVLGQPASAAYDALFRR